MLLAPDEFFLTNNSKPNARNFLSGVSYCDSGRGMNFNDRGWT